MVPQRRVFCVCASKLASDESLGHQHMGTVYHQGRSQIAGTTNVATKEAKENRIGASLATRWWRPCIRVAVYLSIDQGELLGEYRGVKAGGQKGRGSVDESGGAQLPKSNSVGYKGGGLRGAPQCRRRRIYRSRRKGRKCKATDSRAMGLAAPWYRRGGTSVETSIPCSYRGRALVVKGAEEAENAGANSKYQDRVEGQRPRNFIRPPNNFAFSTTKRMGEVDYPSSLTYPAEELCISSKELVLCSHDILASRRDCVAYSVLVRSSFFPTGTSSESATTSINNRSYSGTVQRSDEITVDSTVSGKNTIRFSLNNRDFDRNTDDSSTSQLSYKWKLANRESFGGKQLPRRSTSIASRRSVEDGEKNAKAKKSFGKKKLRDKVEDSKHFTLWPLLKK
ncbi:hypothetical protein BHM03_00016601 [Ensete ventricosum]|nr:hypothetical protein BHM03_00016601 [Ensete ventricosum]